jgi:hypothetical protein
MFSRAKKGEAGKHAEKTAKEEEAGKHAEKTAKEQAGKHAEKTAKEEGAGATFESQDAVETEPFVSRSAAFSTPVKPSIDGERKRKFDSLFDKQV